MQQHNKNQLCGVELFKRSCFILFVFEGFLGIAHVLWPEYQWGQGRHSYFNFGNSLTLASWLLSMQFIGIAILAMIAFHRERRLQNVEPSPSTWIWLAGALLALLLSFAEITRIHHRFELLGYPNPDIYESFIVFSLWLILLVLFGWFLLVKLRAAPGYYKYCAGWLVAWGLNLILTIISSSTNIAHGRFYINFTQVLGLSDLFGVTFLLIALGGYVYGVKNKSLTNKTSKSSQASFPGSQNRIFMLLGVGGTAFVMIFLQILLFQMLTIFGDYLTANMIISIALLGISIGGLIGWYTSHQAPLQTMIGASLLLPVTILLVFGTTVSLMKTQLIASILLMFPFVCGSAVITVALVRTKSHMVYFIDLSGAAIGALLVSVALSNFREESSLLFLSAFTFLLSCCFIIYLPASKIRNALFAVAFAGLSGFLLVGSLNLQSDWLNIVRTKVLKRYPRAEVLFSNSSLVGRYDVIRKKPSHRTLATLENGRIIDNMRRRPTEQYQIDPRLPHTLMKDPVILILGLSGDGITKTSKALGKKVYGVEINPAIVSLQTNELIEFNSNSYEDIEVAVMDGRSFLEKSDQRYDIITLMNAHNARGHTAGSAPSPEYLHTYEAIESYLKHLTGRGVLIVEEPVNRPERELPVWKLLVTMRQALVDRGITKPAQHFFVFQWRTKRNNYIQILMKKNPLTSEEIANLRKWVKDVDDKKDIESRLKRRMGPIRTKTTILHSPDEYFSTNYSRILRGKTYKDFLLSCNLNVTTDNRPFHFDVDPAHTKLKSAYTRTLLMSAILTPFLLSFLVRNRSKLHGVLPHLSVVILTGMGYLLIEIVLIQRYSIFLGYPILTFATILGTLLVCSGLGSLWSSRIGQSGMYYSLAAIIVLLILHLWFIPSLFPIGASLPLYSKVAFAILTLAPLAFFMGVPFPFVLNSSKIRFTESSAGMLFAINGASSALAVPLAMNISTSWGLNTTFQIGLLVYVLVWVLLISMQKRSLQKLTNGFAVLTICLLLACPWVSNKPVIDAESTHYRIYGISYGHSSYREDKVLLGGSPSKSIPFEWLFWVIQGNGQTILVDTGFDDPLRGKGWGISNYVQPAKRLSQLGISPSEITDIILTHTHWDHTGGLAPYGNARVWIQENEYLHAKTTLNPANIRRKGIYMEDLETLTLIEDEGRLNLVSGDKEIAPGITLTLDGSHTPGSQYIIVETLHGPVIIAGDACYTYKNNRWHIPAGNSIDPQTNLSVIRKMHRQAASPFFILPGHDPLVMKWFPEVSDGIVQITPTSE